MAFTKRELSILEKCPRYGNPFETDYRPIFKADEENKYGLYFGGFMFVKGRGRVFITTGIDTFEYGGKTYPGLSFCEYGKDGDVFNAYDVVFTYTNLKGIVDRIVWIYSEQLKGFYDVGQSEEMKKVAQIMENIQIRKVSLPLAALTIVILVTKYANFESKSIPRFKPNYLQIKQITNENKKNITTVDPNLGNLKELRKFNQEKIIISFYTLFYGQRPWDYFLPKDDYRKQCGYSFDNCILSYDVNKWKEVDLLFFHARDMPYKKHLEKMKKESKKSQLWVYFIMENPFNTPLAAPLKGLFELTSSYRFNSDFFYPYGYYDKLTEPEMKEAKRVNKNYAEGKSKQLAWMVTHCGTLRDKLAHKFMEYGIELYVGGGCASRYKNKMKCPDRECLSELKKIKFHFSAENNLCNNYITEKYWRNPFKMDAVPIVLGGSNYSDPNLGIPGSFINALDFKSPKDLVDYIKKVDANDDLYKSYFEWKKYYKLQIKEKMGAVNR